jgi:hypothetical protein
LAAVSGQPERRPLGAPPPTHPLVVAAAPALPPSFPVTSTRAACADGSLARRYRHSLKAPPRGKRELGLAVSRCVAHHVNHWLCGPHRCKPLRVSKKEKGPHPEGRGRGPYGSRRGKRDDGGEVSINVIQGLSVPQRRSRFYRVECRFRGGQFPSRPRHA